MKALGATFNMEKEIVRTTGTVTLREAWLRALVSSVHTRTGHMSRGHLLPGPRTGVPYILISTQSQLTNWLDGQPGTGET